MKLILAFYLAIFGLVICQAAVTQLETLNAFEDVADLEASPEEHIRKVRSYGGYGGYGGFPGGYGGLGGYGGGLGGYPGGYGGFGGGYPGYGGGGFYPGGYGGGGYSSASAVATASAGGYGR